MLIIILLAVTLSLDAFSLALAYGTLSLTRKKELLLSVIVGIYHFLMPMAGMFIGGKLLQIIPIKPELLVFLILLILGLQMIFENNNKISELTSLKELLVFGFAVSVDSFSAGIGIKVLTDQVVLSAIVFMIFSSIFTYMGLVFGKKFNYLLGKKATIIGGIILIIIGLYSLLT